MLLLDMNEERSVNHIRKESGHGQNVDRTIIGLSAKVTHLSSIFVISVVILVIKKDPETLPTLDVERSFC